MFKPKQASVNTIPIIWTNAKKVLPRINHYSKVQVFSLSGSLVCLEYLARDLNCARIENCPFKGSTNRKLETLQTLFPSETSPAIIEKPLASHLNYSGANRSGVREREAIMAYHIYHYFRDSSQPLTISLHSPPFQTSPSFFLFHRWFGRVFTFFIIWLVQHEVRFWSVVFGCWSRH